MYRENKRFSCLSENYVFEKQKREIEKLSKTTDEKIINLGIGDVKLPLLPSCVSAMKKAVEEMENR